MSLSAKICQEGSVINACSPVMLIAIFHLPGANRKKNIWRQFQKSNYEWLSSNFYSSKNPYNLKLDGIQL